MDDAELVRATRTGDRSAFTAIFDRHAGRVHDLALAMLRDRSAALEVVELTFLEASLRLQALEEEHRLAVWLLAVTRRNGALRAGPTAGPDRQPTLPNDDPERVHLAGLVWEAVADLPLRDRTLLDLDLRQGLDGHDLADALGVTINQAQDLQARMRDRVEKGLSGYLIARTADGRCPDLTKVLKGWDGRFTPKDSRRIADHVETCRTCTQTRFALPSPFALYAAALPAPFPAAVRSRVIDRVVLPVPQPGMPVDVPGTGPAVPDHAFSPATEAYQSPMPAPAPATFADPTAHPEPAPYPGPATPTPYPGAPEPAPAPGPYADPTPYPSPAPAYLDPTPGPAPAYPDPTPAPGYPDPAPAYPDPTPAPAPGYPDPNPAPGYPDSAPAPGYPEPTPPYADPTPPYADPTPPYAAPAPPYADPTPTPPWADAVPANPEPAPAPGDLAPTPANGHLVDADPAQAPAYPEPTAAPADGDAAHPAAPPVTPDEEPPGINPSPAPGNDSAPTPGSDDAAPPPPPLRPREMP